MKQLFDNPKPPLQLYVKVGDEFKQQVHHACGECRHIYSTYESALACCKKTYCETCGNETYQYWPVCHNCRDLKRLNLAEEITEHDGPVLWEEADRYFESMDDAVEYFLDDEDQYSDAPEFLLPCNKVEHKRLLDYSSILESATADLFEDAYDHLKGVEDFKKACAEFNAKQMITTWEADYKTKIRLILPPLGETSADEEAE